MRRNAMDVTYEFTITTAVGILEGVVVAVAKEAAAADEIDADTSGPADRVVVRVLTQGG